MDRPTLNRWQIAALWLAIAVVVAGMVVGFYTSFSNLYAAALARGWRFPAGLPLGVDAEILPYVILDSVAVSLGARSRWLHLVAWALAGFTVWANWAVVPGSGVWRTIQAAMPALWVLGVEALRFLWNLLRSGPRESTDRIPLGRWIADPFRTWFVQRRMWLLGETSWKRMALIEEARLHARDVIAEHQRKGRIAPGQLRNRVRSGRLHGTVLDAIDNHLRYGAPVAAIETAAGAWIASQMTLPDRAEADLRDARRSVPQGTAETAVSDAVRDATPEPSGKPAGTPPRTPSRKAAAKPSRAAVKRMTGAELAPYVGAFIERGGGATVQAVMDEFHTGRPKAREALEIASGEPGAAVIELAR